MNTLDKGEVDEVSDSTISVSENSIVDDELEKMLKVSQNITPTSKKEKGKNMPILSSS